MIHHLILGIPHSIINIVNIRGVEFQPICLSVTPVLYPHYIVLADIYGRDYIVLLSIFVYSRLLWQCIFHILLNVEHYIDMDMAPRGAFAASFLCKSNGVGGISKLQSIIYERAVTHGCCCAARPPASVHGGRSVRHAGVLALSKRHQYSRYDRDNLVESSEPR